MDGSKITILFSSVQTKQDFLFRPNTNIRPSKLSEYSAEYEHSDNIRYLAKYSVFGRIFGILAKYSVFYQISGKVGQIFLQLMEKDKTFYKILDISGRLLSNFGWIFGKIPNIRPNYRIFGQKPNIRKSPNYGPVWQHLFRPNIRPNYSDEH